MPTSSMMILPRTISENEFENICKDILEIMYQTNFQIFGRKGQRQNGIDILSDSFCDGHIVAQCKNYYKTTYTNFQKQIITDIESTSKLNIKINTFIAMTSLDRDVDTQIWLTKITAPFKLQILFWEDIQDIICKNQSLLANYYPNIFGEVFPTNERNSLISSAYNLKNTANLFNTDYREYKVAYYEENDISVYNLCVGMVNECFNIKRILDTWYLQLDKLNVIENIEYILANMPPFHDANLDWTGAALVCTIADYIQYFSCDKNIGAFINECDEIMKKIK